MIACKRRWFLALPFLLIGGVLAGCQTAAPRAVLNPPPAPYYHQHRIGPAHPLRPAPAKPKFTTPSLRGATVVIDAGHGGKDPGAWPERHQLPEKAIVLDIANHLAAELSRRGARVVSTRTGDTFLSLEQRAEMAERSRADLFVSVHADSAPRSGASGVGLFIYTHASSESLRAAEAMQQTLDQAGLETRSIKRRNFHVLREHSRPAVLVECGFLTHPGDAARLNRADHRRELARTLADGIARFFAR